MIRVLHVIGAMDRGGAETMIMNLYRAIDRSLIQFDFVVHEERACDYDAEIEALGGRIFRVPRFKGTNARAYRKAFRAFFAEHGEHPIVHGHIGSSAALYLSEARRADRFAIAHSHAQKYPVSLSEIAFRALSYPTRYVADYFMACSQEAGRDRFGRFVTEGPNFSILKNGIDLDLYRCDDAMHKACKKAYGYDEEIPLVGHVGRLDPVKNHRFLLQVFSGVRKELPRARLACVGRGSLAEEIEREACELGIADAVDFFGVREDVPGLLKAFDAFAFPSFKEGLAIAVIEAQATGLPVVASTGVPQAAMLVDSAKRMPLDAGADAWALEVVALLREANARRDHVAEVGERGFGIGESARWLERFYRSVVESGGGCGAIR